jgi:catechol 2,3-dioxygenase-like lactoylglutathione lyase family enzyme
MKLDHIGIAVADLLGAARSMEALGLIRTDAGQLGPEAMQGYPGLNARWAFYGTAKGDSPILLLQPLDAQGPIHDFLGTGKAGMQHLAFAVDDLERTHAILSQAGVQFARQEPFVDPDGNRSHFFLLNGVPGVLFELTQWARKP